MRHVLAESFLGTATIIARLDFDKRRACKHGRNRTNVWDYASVNSMRGSRREDLALHPTVKPTGLVADAIQDVTRRGDLVLDLFLGSGTTLGIDTSKLRNAVAIADSGRGGEVRYLGSFRLRRRRSRSSWLSLQRNTVI